MIPGDVLHPGVDWRSASQHMEIGAHARRLTILVFTRKASVEHGVRKATLQQYVGFLLERHGIALATVTTTAANLSCVACLVLTLPTEWRMNRDFFVCCFQAKDDQALSQPHIYIYLSSRLFPPAQLLFFTLSGGERRVHRRCRPFSPRYVPAFNFFKTFSSYLSRIGSIQHSHCSSIIIDFCNLYGIH